MTSLPIIMYNVIMAKKWFGVVGRNGSGKSTVCEYLVSKGYTIFSLSDIVRNHAKAQDLSLDRDTLTQLANQLKTEHGIDYFAREVYENAVKMASPLIVFDSIRHPSEIDYLRSCDVTFVGVHASLKDCYDRINRRGKGTDFVSFEEFERQDNYEMNGQSFGQMISTCIEMCDFNVKNNGDLRNLYDQVDDMLIAKDDADVK